MRFTRIPERLIPFLGNHDTSRLISANGATPEKVRLAFAVLFTMRGMPQFYSGDEIALSGGDDPDNRRDFPGGWHGAVQDAFSAPTPQQSAMHDYVQSLLTLRAKYPAFQTGEMQILAADKDTLAFARVLPANSNAPPDSADKIIVVVNRSPAASTVNIKLGGTALAGTSESRTLIGEATAHWMNDNATIQIPGNSAWVAVFH